MDQNFWNEYNAAMVLINRLGNNVIAIKGGCITILVGVLSLAPTIDEKLKWLLAIMVVAFWMIEATYRIPMEGSKKRCKELEEYAKNSENNKGPAPTLVTDLESYFKPIKFVYCMFKHRVYPLYILLLIVILLIYK